MALAISHLPQGLSLVQRHAYRGEFITRAMSHRSQASTEGAPRARPSALPSLAIQSFVSFQSQTSHPVPIAVQPSPIRRKPLPAESPVIGRFAAAQFSTRPSTVQDKDLSLPIQGHRRPDNVLSPPLTEDELFVPRNLDEYALRPIVHSTQLIPS